LGRGWPCFGFYFLRSLRYLACTFYFLQIAMYVIGGYCVRTPHSITMSTPVLTTTSTHLSPFSPTTSGASGEMVLPRSSSRVQSPFTPYSSFLNSRHLLSFVSPADSTVVHRHSLPLFLNVDLWVVHTALRLIITPRRPYIPLIFLLDMVIVFICVHL